MVDFSKIKTYSIKQRQNKFSLKDMIPLENDRSIDNQDIEKIAEEWAKASIQGRQRGSGGVLSFWGIGYNQMLHGQHNTISLINLHLLTGNAGRPGCGNRNTSPRPVPVAICPRRPSQ